MGKIVAGNKVFSTGVVYRLLFEAGDPVLVKGYSDTDTEYLTVYNIRRNNYMAGVRYTDIVKYCPEGPEIKFNVKPGEWAEFSNYPDIEPQIRVFSRVIETEDMPLYVDSNSVCWQHCERLSDKMFTRIKESYDGQKGRL